MYFVGNRKSQTRTWNRRNGFISTEELAEILHEGVFREEKSGKKEEVGSYECLNLEAQERGRHLAMLEQTRLNKLRCSGNRFQRMS